jgi:hypothetical protein
MKRTALVSCLLLAGLTACGTLKLDASSVADAKPASPRLTAAEALARSDDYVRNHHTQEPFDSTAYPDRRATWDEGAACWWISYQHVPDRHSGDSFTIRIDDATGAIQFFGGA